MFSGKCPLVREWHSGQSLISASTFFYRRVFDGEEIVAPTMTRPYPAVESRLIWKCFLSSQEINRWIRVNQETPIIILYLQCVKKRPPSRVESFPTGADLAVQQFVASENTDDVERANNVILPAKDND